MLLFDEQLTSCFALPFDIIWSDKIWYPGSQLFWFWIASCFLGTKGGKMKKSFYPAVVLAVGVTLVGVSFAQRPETDIDPHKHANLAEAQHHVLQAYESTKKAEAEHPAEYGGHAGKALETLDLANRELKEAAEFYNQHHK
jgi:hypothetical protein